MQGTSNREDTENSRNVRVDQFHRLPSRAALSTIHRIFPLPPERVWAFHLQKFPIRIVSSVVVYAKQTDFIFIYFRGKISFHSPTLISTAEKGTAILGNRSTDFKVTFHIFL